MAKPTDVRPVGVSLLFLPIKSRVPLKFGPEVTTEVTCARVRLTVEDRQGKRASGWGETPLSVQWVWPSQLSYEERHQALRAFTLEIAQAWLRSPVEPGHPMEVGHRFLAEVLPGLDGRVQPDTLCRGARACRIWRLLCARRRLTWPFMTHLGCFTMSRRTRRTMINT